MKQDAVDFGISVDEKVRADRATAGTFGGQATAGRTVATAQAASALASRGVSNSNLGVKACNIDALRLGEEIGSAVRASAMGAIHYHLCQANDSG